MDNDVSARQSEEMRSWSNWGHWLEGGLLAVIGVLALLEAAGVLTGGWAYAWPIVLVVAGVALPLVIFGHGHETYEAFGGRKALLSDPQQRQHVVISVVLVVSGIAEIVARSADVRWLGFVWPIGLALVGVLFMVHTQHGTSAAARRAVLVHRVLGVTLIAAAAARAVQVALDESSGFWAYLWVILLLLVAAQLIFYREPAGAYQSDEGDHDG